MWHQRDPSSRFMGKNNLVVRNLPKNFETKDLSALFSKSGNIVSAKVSKNSKGMSEGFGFVQFSKNEEAAKAVNDWNNKEVEDKVLLVDFFQRSDIRNKDSPMIFNNLYVKNFPKTWDDAKLKSVFSAYGNVLSAKVDLDDKGQSKGFGFVC